MISAFHLEAVLAIAYALVLIIISAALEWLAKLSHKRADRYHTGGFRFDRDRDAWECPVGIALLRAEIDQERQAVVYRAPAHTCNSCPIKSRCTHSDHGREIVVPLDPWIRSASVRLQRGISLVLLALACFILVLELFRHWHAAERSMLAIVLVTALFRFIKLLGEVRSRPIQFEDRTDIMARL
ncbi:MAG: hypothetical protein JOY54_10135 [Acidobacteriaceae bacterium]|nr:hypothetical protein [Acidobacteriaceae bacterium]